MGVAGIPERTATLLRQRYWLQFRLRVNRRSGYEYCQKYQPQRLHEFQPPLGMHESIGWCCAMPIHVAMNQPSYLRRSLFSLGGKPAPNLAHDTIVHADATVTKDQLRAGYRKFECRVVQRSPVRSTAIALEKSLYFTISLVLPGRDAWRYTDHKPA